MPPTLRIPKKMFELGQGLVVCFVIQVLLSPSVTTTTAQQDDFSCSVSDDRCPTAFDGVCDRKISRDCRYGDCFDCDECQALSYDCGACTSTKGCYWCPDDGTCFNSDQYTYLGLAQSTCSRPEDFLEDSCYAGNDAQEYTTDPLISAQRWVFDMVNLDRAWDLGYTGRGVRVRINDNGIDASHGEFEGRFDAEASCLTYLPTLYPERAPFLSHGTAVASIVGGAADNDLCSVGIAPQVTLSSCDVFQTSLSNEEEDDYLNPNQLQLYDISQNSFGTSPCEPRDLSQRGFYRDLQQDQQTGCPFLYDQQARQGSFSNVPFPCNVCSEDAFADTTTLSWECENAIILHCWLFFEDDPGACLQVLDLLVEDGQCHFGTLSQRMRQGLQRGIQEGRDGKGIIFVYAAGNSYATGGDTNLQGVTQSRFVVTVGAVGKDGLHSSYSSPGASVFVSAPGGDDEVISSHVVAAVGGTCQDAGSGTSYACPVVSGVLALMLEANSELTWRDAQEILALTAQSMNDQEDDNAGFNAAGYWHSNLYGFGVVDAGAAVQAAEVWNLLRPEQMETAGSGLVSLPIADDSTTPTTSTITLALMRPPADGEPAFTMEGVEVLLDLDHYARGHLEIRLTSPQGTTSILHGGYYPENTQLDPESRWKFLTLKNWGEQPEGAWTLEIVDRKKGDVANDDCVDASWIYQDAIDTTIRRTCRDFERFGYCRDGMIDPSNLMSAYEEALLFEVYEDSQGLKASDACCACGGQGVNRNDVADELRQWNLVVYGHQGDVVTTLTPTANPTNIPTTPNPTTQSPTLVPTSSAPNFVFPSPTMPSVADKEEEDDASNQEITKNIFSVGAYSREASASCWITVVSLVIALGIIL